MRNLIAAFAGLLALVGSASAATVTYKMVFEDGAGARVGTGTMNVLNDQSREVFLSYYGTAVCSGPSPYCYNSGLHTPIRIEADMGGNYIGNGGLGDLYADAGHLIDPIRPWYGGEWDPSTWTLLTTLPGGFETWFFIAVTRIFGGATTSWAFDDGLNVGAGTVRLVETPLPAAAWVFLAGLAGLVRLKASRSAR